MEESMKIKLLVTAKVGEEEVSCVGCGNEAAANRHASQLKMLYGNTVIVSISKIKAGAK